MKLETRALKICPTLRNAEGENPKAGGLAAPFDSYSVDFGDWKEKIASTAFDETLAKVANGEARVSFLWSHDTSQPLCSTRTGKLVLTKTDAGLEFEADTSSLTKLMRTALDDGELGVSIGFLVNKEKWERVDDDPNIEFIHTLEEVELLEISLVLDAAYPDTSAAKRSLEAFREEFRAKDNQDTGEQLRKLQFLQVKLRANRSK